MKHPCKNRSMAPRVVRVAGLLLLLLAGCRAMPRLEPCLEPIDGKAIIFVADGAGNFQAASAAMKKTVARSPWPVQVETFEWSHGFGRILSDELDYAHARAEGERLAGHIRRVRQAHPDVKIYLVGHSAGAAVVTAAAEALSPGDIAGMALLSPSLSQVYDLRPALSAVSGHLDVYYSRHDWLYLGVATSIWGTTDRVRALPGGRVGFCLFSTNPADAELYRKVRQHPWQPWDRDTGNRGGHYGAYQPGFLDAVVLPLLLDNLDGRATGITRR
jgi:pimeloyl-ACP methyl ester carboxylesterase